jgi:hypothetical protein
MWAAVAAVLVIGISTVVALVRNADDEVATAGSVTGSAQSSTTTPPTSVTSATPTPTPTRVAPSVTPTRTAPRPTPTRTTARTTAQQGAVPGAVTGLTAGPGGGSGEITVRWDAVARATGFRVLRSDTAAGPFDVAANFDITTGTTTAAPDVVNIWSAQHSYVPSQGTLDGPDQSPWFEYVEYSGAPQRCYRVIAYNASGDGPASAVACGGPPHARAASPPDWFGFDS